MQTTPNLGLKKPEGTDIVDIQDFNANADVLDTAVAGKVDKVSGKQLSTEDYTTAEKTKLTGIAAGANNYTHPATHPPSIIVQDSSNRFVTDAEKSTWNAKAGAAVATTSVNGLMSSDDKSKLDGIATGANNYVHPATHPPAIIAQDANNRFTTDTEKATWNGKAGTAVATTSANGLMSSADKSKLDGVAAGANNYTHPTGDGNQHVPATGTTNNGKVLKSGATAGSAAWGNVAFSEVTGKPTTLSGYGITDAAPSSHVGAGGAAHADVTTTTDGFMMAADKVKLDGITAGANNYTHPATHPPSIIVQDASNRFVTDTEKSTWNGKAGTAVATTSANGLMSSTDKSKLDGIAAGAQVNTVTSVAGRTGAVTLSNSDIGLGNVDNAKQATKAEFDAHTADYVRQPGYGTTAGSANAYTLTLSPALTAYTAGVCVAVKIHAANTGSSTININGLGAKTIKDSKGNNLSDGKFVLNGIYTLRYDGTSFMLQGEGGDSREFIVKDVETPVARAAAAANLWYSVCYGNGLFVAVSSDGTNRVMTSPDGITWTARAATAANYWYSVCYGNGLFVAVSSDGTNQVMTSPDGINWTARAAAAVSQWHSVCYGNGLFVAVAYSGTNRVMTSPDGITWTARAATAANYWYSVCYGNGLFVAVADSGTNRVMTSPDGITWTTREAAASIWWRSVCYGNGLFVAVAVSGTNQVMTSPDGITWTARAAAVSIWWGSVCYGNGLFVAVASSGTNRVMTMNALGTLLPA